MLNWHKLKTPIFTRSKVYGKYNLQVPYHLHVSIV
jgi:hypothetical protein